MFNKLSELEAVVTNQKNKKRLVLCSANEYFSIEAAYKAHRNNIIDAIFVGEEEKILKLAKEFDLDLSGITIINENSLEGMIETSIKLINNKQADILMKGSVSTALLLKGILNKEWGLRKKPLLSHYALFDIPQYHKLLCITDVAMNIAPNLQDKISIINNAVEFTRKLGVEMPKVAALAAVEMVNEKMPATLDAALLSIMDRRGQIKNCTIDGPLAFDNAISFKSKEHKGITGSVAGDADILLVPNIEAGNILYKSFVFFANAKVASVVLGATAPIVLTSRADSDDTKLNSIMLSAASFDL